MCPYTRLCHAWLPTWNLQEVCKKAQCTNLVRVNPTARWISGMRGIMLCLSQGLFLGCLGPKGWQVAGANFTTPQKKKKKTQTDPLHSSLRGLRGGGGCLAEGNTPWSSMAAGWHPLFRQGYTVDCWLPSRNHWPLVNLTDGLILTQHNMLTDNSIGYIQKHRQAQQCFSLLRVTYCLTSAATCRCADIDHSRFLSQWVELEIYFQLVLLSDQTS